MSSYFHYLFLSIFPCISPKMATKAIICFSASHVYFFVIFTPVCSYVCGLIYVLVNVHTCVYLWRIFPQCVSPYSLRQGLSLKPRACWFGYSVQPSCYKNPVFTFHPLEVQVDCHAKPSFSLLLGIQTLIIMLAQQED